MGESGAPDGDTEQELVPVTSKVRPDTRDWLDEQADQRGESRSKVIKHIIEQEQKDQTIDSDLAVVLSMAAATLYFGVQAATPAPGWFVIGGGVVALAMLVGAGYWRYQE